MSISPLTAAVSDMMHSAWREPGFCVPNAQTYPFQWLWDSCFHSLIWNRLGSDRAEIELRSALSHQDESGFIPHMTYWGRPDVGQSFWGRPATSCITQPPMYGHVIAELGRAGTKLDEDVFGQAVRGLLHLVSERPRTDSDLITIFHPWESGCDDSARWDSWRNPTDRNSPGVSPQQFQQQTIDDWKIRKGELVRSLSFNQSGAPIASDEFTVGSIGFNALVSWNSDELLAAAEARSGNFGDAVADQLLELQVKNSALKAAINQRWDPGLLTWLDDGPTSGRIRTADALLALLVDPRPEAFDQLIKPEAFGGEFGVRGVHQGEPSYDPSTYWRGPTWPQLTYLLWLAARAHSTELASAVAERLVAGVIKSGLAEYWHPETGQGLGAIPQTWSGLALVVAD